MDVNMLTPARNDIVQFQWDVDPKHPDVGKVQDALVFFLENAINLNLPQCSIRLHRVYWDGNVFRAEGVAL